MALQSSQRLPELQFYTKKSYRILQLQFYKGTHTTSIHLHHTENSSIQNPILHAEDKELFEYYYYYYYYYIQRAKRPSFQKRNSTHRKQRDLLEIHLCVLQDLPKAFQAFKPQDLPKAFQTFQSFTTFQPIQAILQNSRESTPFQHSSIRMHILQFYSSIGFHRNSTEYQLDNTNYKHYILQRKGDVVISVNLAFSRIELRVKVTSEKTNCKNDIQ